MKRVLHLVPHLSTGGCPQFAYDLIRKTLKYTDAYVVEYAFIAPDFVVQNQADNEAGTIDYTVVQLPPSEPSKGEGVAALVTLRAKQPTQSRIEIESFLLADTSGGSIDAVHRDGQVRVRRSIPAIPIVAGGIALVLVLGGTGYAVRRRRQASRPGT